LPTRYCGRRGGRREEEPRHACVRVIDRSSICYSFADASSPRIS
jgi:hypothetical protein